MSHRTRKLKVPNAAAKAHQPVPFSEGFIRQVAVITEVETIPTTATTVAIVKLSSCISNIQVVFHVSMYEAPFC
jgi:hypothetical protein